MHQSLILTTERLRIREFTLADLDTLHALQQAAWPDDSTTLDERTHWLRWTVMSYREYANLYQPPYGERAVTLNDSGELVGVVGLVPCLLPAYALHQNAQANGQDTPQDARVLPEIGLY